MRFLRRRELSAIIVCLLLLVSLLPLSVVKATSNYFQFTSLSSLATSPMQVNQQNIDVSAVFTNVVGNSITYRVDQMVFDSSGTLVPTGSSASSSGQSPIIVNNQVTFKNVQLFSGLNRITFSGQSVGTSNSIVNTSGYVYYSNVPVITSITTGFGQDVNGNGTVIVSSPSMVFNVNAPNTSILQVYQAGNPNPYSAIPSGGVSFIVPGINLTLGANDFTFVATNGDRSYSLNREIIYYGSQPTSYGMNLQFGASNHETLSNNNPVFTEDTNANPLKSFTGEMLVPYMSGQPSQPVPSVVINVYDASGALVDSIPAATLTSDPTNSNSSYTAYTLSGTFPYLSTHSMANGNYKMQVQTTFNSVVSNQDYTFSLHNPNGVYFASVSQLFGVHGDLATGVAPSATPNSYADSSVPVSGTLQVTQLPFYLDAAFSGQTVTLADMQSYLKIQLNQNGTTTTLSSSDYQIYPMNDGSYAIRFNVVPTGDYQITLNYTDTSGTGYSDSNSFIVNSVLAANIQLSNIYDGQSFGSASQLVYGKLVNFQSADYSTLTATLNGTTFYPGTSSFTLGATTMATSASAGATTIQVASAASFTPSQSIKIDNGAGGWVTASIASVSGNTLTLNTGLSAAVAANAAVQGQPNVQSDGSFSFPMTLVPGVNHLVIKATANSGNSATAVPVTINYTLYYNSGNLPTVTVPVSGVLAFADSNGTIPAAITSTNNNTFSTSGSYVSITGNITYANNFMILQDGNQVFNVDLTNISNTPALTVTPNGTGGYSFALNTQFLHDGTTTFTFTATDGSGNQVSTNVSVTKVPQPFTVVSPSMPASGSLTLNQNFIDLTIQTTTADAVTIGGVNAVVTSQDMVHNISIYGAEVPNLKVGQNTISIQITRGSTKVKGSIPVNYVNQDVIDAQYKTLMPKTGKLGAFNGLVQLQFPKNTVFQQQNPFPGQPNSNTQLFANQTILFGITDRYLGAISNDTSSIPPRPNSPFPSIPYSLMDDRIPLDSGENYAGTMVWLDAGDPTQVQTPTSFVPPGGLDPATSGTDQYYYNRRTSPNYWMEPTNQGTITLQYDPGLRNAATANLTILHLNHETNHWDKVGGVVNTKNHTISAPFDEFGYYVAATVNSTYSDLSNFTDIGDSSWARNYLEIMMAKGIMQPESATQFGVYDNITRGEFAQVLIKALGIPLNYDQNNSFDDVPYSQYQAPGQMWSYPYIETAVRSGIVHGVGTRAFGPNYPITRQDACVMIARAAQYKLSLDPNAAIAALNKAFLDGGGVNGYAATAVLAVYKNGIMNGIPTNPGAKKTTYSFDPGAPLQRSQAAVIGTKLMQQLGLIPKTF